MQLEGPQPDSSSRVHVVEDRDTPDRGRLHLGAHLSGVLTGPASRSEAARWIATETATTAVDLTVVQAQWQLTWSRRRDELAAAHASHRLEGYRIDAALERARDRLPAPGAPVSGLPGAAQPAAAPEVAEPPSPAPAPAPEAAREDAPAAEEEPPVDWAHPPDAATHMRTKLKALVAAIDALEPEPLPEGLLLADAFDAHAALLRARRAADELPVADIEALEARVNAARALVERSARRVTDGARNQIEHCHRVVVEAEGALFEAKRRQRDAALARYEEAVADELVALASAGLDSYASFLFEITGGNATADLGARLAAETELAEARTALDVARQVPSVPTRSELDARETQMRARATELLGHAPGADPASELRALRVDAVGGDDTIREISEVLSHGGVTADGDVVECARLVLAGRTAAPAAVPTPEPAPVPETEPPPAPPIRASLEALPAWAAPPGAAVPPRASAPAPVAPAGTVDPARWREIADLEEQRSAHNRTLRELEAELARIDRIREAGATRLGGSDLTRALASVLATFRAGELVGGRPPLILDGVLDGLTVADREAALKVFADSPDVQTVVVTDDPEVMQSLSREGGTLVRWPEPLVTLTEEPDADLRAARTRRA